MTVGGEEAIVPLVVVEREAHTRRPPRGELVVQHQRRIAGGNYLDAFQRVRAEESEVLEDLVPRGERATDGAAIESREQQLAAVQVDRRRPVRIEEIRIEIAELEELPQARDLEREARRVPVAEQVVLGELCLAEKALASGEAEADLERTGQLLLDRDVENHLVVACPIPGGC